MTSTSDFDRVLGAWLDEGPNAAPDRPVDLAVDHARRHPRRRDPFKFLRPDPMAGRRAGLALRPVLVLAALALLVAAVAAIGVGGRRDAVVVPPTPSPSATAAVASPAPSKSFHVELTVPSGQAQTVDVVDNSGLLVEATTGSPTGENGQSFPFDSVESSNVDAQTITLGWAGYPCQTDHTLTIAADGGTMTLERPACSGDTDTMAIDRVLVLRFSKPVAAADVKVTLVP